MKMRKIMAVAMGLSMLLASESVAFAGNEASDRERPTMNGITVTTPVVPEQANKYTWERAADLAISNFLDFKTNEIQRAKWGRQQDDLKKAVDNLKFLNSANVMSRSDTLDKSDPLVDNMESLSNAASSLSEKTALQKEGIKDNVKSAFINIYKAEKQMSALDSKIALNKSLLAADQKKLQLGLISKYDLESNFNGYQKDERTRTSLKVGIDKAYTSLKNLMGLKSDGYIELNHDFIDQLKVIPLDYKSGFDSMNNTNMKIMLLQNIAQRANDYKVGVTYRYPSGDTTSDLADLDYDAAVLNLSDAKRNMPYQYDTAYNNLMDAYDAYTQKNRDFELQKLNLKNMKVKLKVGSSSQLELKAATTQYQSAEFNLIIAKMDYAMTRLSLDMVIKGTN